MRRIGTIVVVIAGGLAAMLALSGGTSKVPVTPQGPAGMPTPFLGVALLGQGGPAAAVDAYGSIVEMRAPGPAGEPLISVPYKRQRAGSVNEHTGVVVRAAVAGREPEPLWRGAPRQRYVGGGTVLETRARQAGVAVRVRDAMAPTRPVWARRVVVRALPGRAAGAGESDGPGGAGAVLEISLNFDFGRARGLNIDPDRRVERGPDGSFIVTRDEHRVSCRQASRAPVEASEKDGVVRLRWTSEGTLVASLLCLLDAEGEGPEAALATVDSAPEALPEAGDSVAAAVEETFRQANLDAERQLAPAYGLGVDAPNWARRLHRRSLLALLALSDRRTGAAPAGLRDHWHYVWPRDAATAALALQRAGLRERAAKIAAFVASLDVEGAARFHPDGRKVDDGRHRQGDGAGWARLALDVLGIEPPPRPVPEWRGSGDYGERDDDRGDYLANAIVAGAPTDEIEAEFARGGRLVREGARSRSDKADPFALDVAAGWAVRPFPRPRLFPLVRATLLDLAATTGPYGLFPSTDWTGRDPWTAATASTAWALAALGERDTALRLMRAVDRAATPTGLLPERADMENGLPRSTTPLAWSHAFAVLALQDLWPAAPRGGRP